MISCHSGGVETLSSKHFAGKSDRVKAAKLNDNYNVQTTLIEFAEFGYSGKYGCF